ncbi:MAG: DNA mismatch repair endonuclease MutL [Myxococcales bacterium]|nr:DNA mismatch repair endonuclease MutL [Myxococcales bacterium]
MTSRIRILDDTLVDQIAAGEVVERPASAVKELLENAIDAGASKIELEIEDGGKRCIRVADDGSGMAPEDAELAVRRHATSKIRTFDDLLRVRTLGFRGEALPSIASVSRFSIRTRPHDRDAGVEVRVEGGAEPVIRPAGGAPGTTVEVRDLFYNVPARRKFLKATHAEAARIHDVFLRMALAHPEIRFVFRSGDRELRSLAPSVGLPGRAEAIFRGEPLEEIAVAERGLRFEAMLGPGSASRQNSRQLYLFVNGRAVIDAALVRAITQGYGAELPPGRFPIGVVHIHLPPEEVDVNVHPQKTEVRLAHAHERQRQIQAIVARRKERASVGVLARPVGYWDERLSGGRIEPDRASAVREAPSDLWARPTTPEPRLTPEKNPSPPRDRWGIGAALLGEEPAPVAEEPAPAEAPAPAWRLLGRAHGRYLVCESTEGVVVIDAVAAGARFVEAQLAEALDAGPIPARRLVFPPRVDVPDAIAAAEREGEKLAALGFDVSALSPSTLAIHALPAALRGASPEAALVAALEAPSPRAALPALAALEGEPAGLDEERTLEIVRFVERMEPRPSGLVRTMPLTSQGGRG